MNDLRTAAQQALEALECSETTVQYEGFGMARRDAERKHQTAIDALRAALAQQAEPVEPVATLTAQRDALLEALKEITPSICHVSIVPEEKCAQCGRIARARAVIKMAEETK